MSKHMKFKWLTEVKSKWILGKWSHISEEGYSGIIPFVYEGKEQIHKYTCNMKSV